MEIGDTFIYILEEKNIKKCKKTDLGLALKSMETRKSQPCPLRIGWAFALLSRRNFC